MNEEEIKWIESGLEQDMHATFESHALPKGMKQAINHNIDGDLPDFQKMLDEELNLFKQAEPDPAHFVNGRGKMKFLIERAFQVVGSTCENGCENMLDAIEHGVDNRFEVRNYGTFPQAPKIPKNDADDHNFSKPKKGWKNKKVPAWMTERDIEKLCGVFEKERLKYPDKFRELSVEEAEDFYVTLAFPVHQGSELFDTIAMLWLRSKTRMCLDFRHLNYETATTESLKMFGSKTLVNMLSFFLAEDENHFFLDNDRKMMMDHIRSELDFAKKLKTGQFTFEKERVKKPKKAEVPFVAKLDFAGYFHQFSMRWKEYNAIAIPYIDDVGEKKFKIYASSLCHFGSLHSVYWACALSSLLSSYLTQKLMTPMIIYVDDSIIFSRGDKMSMILSFLNDLFEIVGLKTSSEKEEMQTINNPSLTVLGLDFEYSDKGQKISINPKKRNRLLDKIDLLLEDGGPPGEKDLLKVLGLCAHFSSHLRPSNFRLRFKKLFSLIYQRGVPCAKTWRAQNCMLKNALKDLKKAAEGDDYAYTFTIKSINTPCVHLYTDASACEKFAIVGGILMCRGVTDATGHTALRNYGFSWEIVREDLPAPLRGASIAVFEMLAIKLAFDIFKSRLQLFKFKTFLHVDNVGCLFNLLAGSSHSPMVKNALSHLYYDNQSVHFFASYINTCRNIADLLTRKSKFKNLFKITTVSLIPVSGMLKKKVLNAFLAERRR